MINSFLQNSSELDERNKLQDQIFSYILQNHILHHQPNLSLPNKRNVFGGTQPMWSATKPNCDETMSLVAEDLLNKFDNIQDGWVVLVGDGKTNKHLMNIKKQYNTALQKFLLFPAYFEKLSAYFNENFIMLPV